MYVTVEMFYSQGKRICRTPHMDTAVIDQSRSQNYKFNLDRTEFVIQREQ